MALFVSSLLAKWRCCIGNFGESRSSFYFMEKTFQHNNVIQIVVTFEIAEIKFKKMYESVSVRHLIGQLKKVKNIVIYVTHPSSSQMKRQNAQNKHNNRRHAMLLSRRRENILGQILVKLISVFCWLKYYVTSTKIYIVP